MKICISYFTGCVALIAVSAAVLVTIKFLATRPDAGTIIATAMLGGAGSAMGALIGGALVLRFKSARRFIKKLIYDKEEE